MQDTDSNTVHSFLLTQQGEQEYIQTNWQLKAEFILTMQAFFSSLSFMPVGVFEVKNLKCVRERAGKKKFLRC